MHARILGPLELWEDGIELRLGTGRQRALLALLLLHANEVVSTDRLIDDLWTDPPPTAAKVVQGYVSQLRKVLPDGVLLTRPTGYVLAVAETDAAEFERLVEEAQTLEPAEAARKLRRGLGLWRGRPFVDVEYEGWAQPEIRRLEELRLVALEDRIDAELQLGRHGILVAELEALVAEYPLRERLCGQLMLALYRSGRQAEALDAYTDARRRLIDELGVEPGPELEDLQRRILVHDPALGPLARPRAPLARRRPLAILFAGGLLVIAAAATALFELTTGSGAGIGSLAAGSIGVIDSRSGRVVGQIPVSGGPSRLAAGGDSIWVASDRAGTVAEVSPHRGILAPTVAPIAGFPSAVAVGDRGVWVLDGVSGLLDKIDPSYGSVVRRLRVATRNPAYDRSRESLDPDAVAAGLGSVWTTDGSRRLTKVDPATMRVVARIDLGVPLDGVAVGGGAVWAISGADAMAIALDREGHTLVRIPIVSRPGFASPYPLAIAAGQGFVWVLNGNTATLTKIDPEQRTIAATVQIGIDHAPVRLAVGDGAAWLADSDGTLARIDASTNAVTLRTLGGRVEDVAVARRMVWVIAGPGFDGRVPARLGRGGLRPLPTSSCSPIYYQAGSNPQYLLVADVSLQGPGSALVAQDGEAVQLALEQHRFRAGRFTLGLQVCDDSTVQALGPSAARCASNAHAYARDASVIGIIGAWSSFCSQVEVPITERARGGPLAMIAPANTYVGLTHRGPGTAADEPARYYPGGVRNYVRVSASDDVQGAADALFARRLGAKRIYVVNDGTSYGDGIAADVAAAASRLQLNVVGTGRWNFQAGSNQRFVERVRRTRPDAVFLGSFLFPQSGRLIKDLRAALPARTQLLLPDGFAPPATLVAKVGSVAEGSTISVAGVPASRLPPQGRRFVAEFVKAIGEAPLEPGAIAAAQATEVLLDAIARSDGTRTSVTRQLFETRIRKGILGSFSFDRNGDTTAGAVTVYRIVNGRARVARVLTPSSRLLDR